VQQNGHIILIQRTIPASPVARQAVTMPVARSPCMLGIEVDEVIEAV